MDLHGIDVYGPRVDNTRNAVCLVTEVGYDGDIFRSVYLAGFCLLLGFGFPGAKGDAVLESGDRVNWERPSSRFVG